MKIITFKESDARISAGCFFQTVLILLKCIDNYDFFGLIFGVMFKIYRLFVRVSIERQIMDGPAGIFLQDEYFITIMLTYVPGETSIPYSKKELMRE